MSQIKNPAWWTTEHDSAWERTKAAFKRDWDQTKHDVGGTEPDTAQGVKDTVKQAAGKEAIPPRGQPAFDKAEPAYRFGHGARAHYGKDYATWDDEVEGVLQSDWGATYPDRDWDEDAKYIRQGWDYEK